MRFAQRLRRICIGWVVSASCFAAVQYNTDPGQLVAVEPIVSPIGKSTTVSLASPQAGSIRSVSLAQGGAFRTRVLSLSSIHGPFRTTSIQDGIVFITASGEVRRIRNAPPNAPLTEKLSIGAESLPRLIAADEQFFAAVTDNHLRLTPLDADHPKPSTFTAPILEETIDVVLSSPYVFVATKNELLVFTVTNATLALTQTQIMPTTIHSLDVDLPVVVVGQSAGLDILTINDEGTLTQQSHLSTSTAVESVKLQEQLGAAALGQGGVMFFDYAIAAEPVWLSRFSNVGDVRTLSVANSTVLANTGDGRHLVFDISNPTAPIVKSAFRDNADPKNVFHFGDIAWIVDKNELREWNVRHDAPRLHNTDLDAGQGVNYGGQRKGHYDRETHQLFVADWFSGLHIYNVQNPKRPRLVSTFHTPGSAKGVVVRDGIAYVADDDHGLQIVDVRDAAKPTLISNLPLNGLAYTPLIERNILYMASHHGGFQIIDIADPSKPKLVSEFDTPGKAWSLARKDNVLIVADSESGLIGFDVSDVSQPKPLWEFNPGGHSEDILVSDSFAYAAFFDGMVYSLDVSNPLSPQVIGQIRTPGNARGLAKQADRLYVADWLGGVVKLDVADPKTLRQTAWVDTDGATWGVHLAENFVFAFDWWGGLVVLEDDPTTPLMIVGQYNQRDVVHDLAVEKNYLFTAEGEYGLQVYDINNPLNPTWAAGLELDGKAKAAAATMGHVFIALEGGNLVDINVLTPFAPRVDGLIKTQSEIQTLDASNGMVVYVTGDNMLCVATTSGFKPARCQKFEDRIADVNLFEDTLTVASPTRVWQWSGDAFPDNIKQTYAVDGPVRFVRARQDALFIVTDDGRLDRYDVEGIHRTRLAEDLNNYNISDVAIVSNGIAFATPQGVTLLDISPQSPVVMRTYDAGRPITKLLTNENTIYGASSASIYALTPAPTITWTNTDDAIAITVPKNLAEGSYHVDVSVNDEKFRFPNVINRTLVSSSKPKMTLDEFNRLWEKKRSQLNPANSDESGEHALE